MDAIPFNIWDDYYGDGCAPAGECQETAGYVEEHDELSEGQREAIAAVVFAHIQTLDMTGVEVTLEGEQVCFKHLTHARLGRLMEELEASNLRYEGTPFNFYSES